MFFSKRHQFRPHQSIDPMSYKGNSIVAENSCHMRHRRFRTSLSYQKQKYNDYHVFRGPSIKAQISTLLAFIIFTQHP